MAEKQNLKSSSNPYAGYSFEGKEPWEVVKLVFHPHWATLLKSAVLILVLWIIIGLVFLFFRASWVTAYAIFGALGLTVLYGGLRLFLWYNTIGIITDYRVIQVSQRGLFDREVAATMWSNIMSVTVYTPGVLPSIFGFGKIVCDPGGSEKTVDLLAVPDAFRVQQMALGLMRQAQEDSASGLSQKDLHAQKKSETKTLMD